MCLFPLIVGSCNVDSCVVMLLYCVLPSSVREKDDDTNNLWSAVRKTMKGIRALDPPASQDPETPGGGTPSTLETRKGTKRWKRRVVRDYK